MLTVTIDGKKVEVSEGETILRAARKAGVWIPTLCHHDAVAPAGSCRICMVEVTRGKRSRLVTACNYEIREEIAVSVSSPRAVEARRGVMRLLLARSPESAELRELARRMGVEGTPYPTVTESQRNCILCGLCVRVCEEVVGKAAIGFAGRGVEKAVAPPFRLSPDACIACGACAAVCPVGTIRVRYHGDTGEVEISPFKARRPVRTCAECGTPLVPSGVVDEMKAEMGRAAERLLGEPPLCAACRRKRTAEKAGRAALARR